LSHIKIVLGFGFFRNVVYCSKDIDLIRFKQICNILSFKKLKVNLLKQTDGLNQGFQQ